MGSTKKAKEIRKWRKKAGLKQIELAELIKTSQQNISRAENNYFVSREMQENILQAIRKLRW